MWKRKSMPPTSPAINTITVSETPPPRAIRTYKIISITRKTRIYHITSPPSKEVLYTLRFRDPPQWSMILEDPSAKIVAATTSSIHNDSTRLALGDPTSRPDTSEQMDLVLVSDWKHKTYDISMVLPPSFRGGVESRVLELQWKGTHDVTKFSAKIDRGMHHKLLSKASDQVLARYVHNLWSMEIEGTIEICADIPSIAPHQWDLFVLTSGMIIADRTIRIATVKMGGVELPNSMPNGSKAAYKVGWDFGRAKGKARVDERKKKNAAGKVGKGNGVGGYGHGNNGEEFDGEGVEGVAEAANAAAGAFAF